MKKSCRTTTKEGTVKRISMCGKQWRQGRWSTSKLMPSETKCIMIKHQHKQLQRNLKKKMTIKIAKAAKDLT